MDAIAVWFSSLSKSGKTTAVLVYVMVFMSVSTVIAIEYQQDQVAKIPVNEIASLSYSQETLSAVTEQKRILMVFDEDVPFKTKKVEDPTMPKGQSYVQTSGVKGNRDVTYEITYNNGKETNRKVLKEKLLKKPIDEVKVVGTYESPAKPVTEPQALGAQTSTDSLQNKAVEQPYTRIFVWEDWNFYCVPAGEEDTYGRHKVIGRQYESESKCLRANEDWPN